MDRFGKIAWMLNPGAPEARRHALVRGRPTGPFGT